MKKKLFGLIVFVAFLAFFFASYYVSPPEKTYADELSDGIQDELENLDLSELERFYNENVKTGDVNFTDAIKNLLEGKYEFDYGSLLDYSFKVALGDVFRMLPTFLTVIAICVLCALLAGVKGSFFDEGIAEIIFFVCSLCVVLLLSTEILAIWLSSQKAIENIAILCEIMSPVILTLMIASGGTVSASVYKPSVLFLSGGVIGIISDVIFPLVGIMIIFSVVNAFSRSVKLNKFSDGIAGAIKWIIGLSFTVYGLFLSVQGITSATFDGISLKAAKYAISNSVPIVGGYIRDGFDLVVAGSVLIKNAVGITGVFALFFVLLSPIVQIASASVLLRLTSGFVGAIAPDASASALCSELNKGTNYIAAAVLCSGLAFFVTVLLMIFSANAFI